MMYVKDPFVPALQPRPIAMLADGGPSITATPPAAGVGGGSLQESADSDNGSARTKEMARRSIEAPSLRVFGSVVPLQSLVQRSVGNRLRKGGSWRPVGELGARRRCLDGSRFA